MHWVLVRLLKMAPDAVPAEEIRAILDAQFTAEGLRREAEFISGGGRSERPYGWGWALTLIHELGRVDRGRGRLSLGCGPWNRWPRC